MKRFSALITALLIGFQASAQDSINFPTLGEIRQHHPDLAKLIDPKTPIQVITSGYVWTEGPAWNKEGQFLVFSEIPSNTVYQWVEGKGASKWFSPSGYTGVTDYGTEPGSNGLMFDPEGRLISCEHGDRRVSVMLNNGGKKTLADNYNGKRFNSPNDVTRASNGNYYFTDPPYGLPDRFTDPRREMDYCGVYLLRPSGEVVLLTKEIERPNGIGLSPDQKTLYVAQSFADKPTITSFPVNADGTVGEGKLLYDSTPLMGPGRKGNPDGLKVDSQGNLWASGPGGIMILNAEGNLLGHILTGEQTSNCAFGGPDGSILYITADTYVLRVQTKVSGIGF
ncbi:MAG: SMP-30/gluconolactonase/LRE family protein [Verrucomicrobia bacterium]|nr:SMP-30/gluconolactonase/LRE family protein [Verrucomicrobiota bacterium]MDA1068055.1 SMP-30/gluconolactonase/LRE family protein [Verrucomicrobiota bacterium]